uniref:Protein YIP n=1 Tax=Chenopodium quinoa TaxID=63459 RepID=A0A803NDG3_CHEQI
MLHQRQVPTAPFQPQRPSSSLPFMSFDISSAFPPPHLPSSPLFSDEPPLLEELEINPSLIWHKTRSLLNPFRVNSSLHLDPDLSGPFLYYIVFGLFQLLAGKVQFGVILGWIAISSIFLYTILNFLAGRNGNLDLYRCFSVVGYCLMPIVIYSAASLFLPPTGTTPGFVVAAVFVIWATRVCSRLLTVDELGASEHRGLIAYPCFLIYCLFSMLVMF